MYLVSIYSIFIKLLYIVLTLLLVFITKCCYENVRKYKLIGKFPSPKVNSVIFGHLDQVNRPTDELFQFLRIWAKKYYPHYILRILNIHAVNILTPEDAEIVMSTKKHSSKSVSYFSLKQWLRDGLLLSGGDKWLQRRKILTPTFHFEILKNFIRTFNDETEKLLQIISRKENEIIDVFPLVSEFALYSINETAMGIELDPNDKDQLAYRNAIYEIEKIILYKLLRPWFVVPLFYYLSPTYLKERKILKVLHKFTRNVIKKRIESFQNISDQQTSVDKEDKESVYFKNKKKRFAMLDILIQANRDGEQIDYDGICEEVDTFMFEGHDTTATALSFILMLLANHPGIQETIYEEITAILADKNAQPTYEDLQKMDLLERCIKESLRLYPSVHFISRACDEDTTLASGLIVPKGVIFQIHIFDILRNPEVFPEPNIFDPDRFLPENTKTRNPFAFIPFSAGPRNCIGQKFAMLEMKALVSGIIKRFKLIAVDTPDTITLKAEIILRTKDGVKMKFIARNEH